MNKNIKWTKHPAEHPDEKPYFSARSGFTIYRVIFLRSKGWVVEDSHGAVWGGYKTSIEAKATVEGRLGTLR